MSTAVVAKKDIEILTKEVLNKHIEILETIQNEHLEIDSSLLQDNFVPEYERKIQKIACPISQLQDQESFITLTETEMIQRGFDNLDRKISETKLLTTTNSIGMGNNMSRKEKHGLKRIGSVTDVNRTMVRSSSSQSLNATKGFIETQMPLTQIGHTSNIPSMPNNREPTLKLNDDQIVEHNSLKSEIQSRISSIRRREDINHKLFKDISQKYMSSFQRLSTFFEEVLKIQADKTTPSDSNHPLMSLDQDLVALMQKFSEASNQVRFIRQNQNLYTSDIIEQIDSLLTDDLTDILEYFYRESK